MSRQKRFTLMEMAVAMVVGAILAAGAATVRLYRGTHSEPDGFDAEDVVL